MRKLIVAVLPLVVLSSLASAQTPGLGEQYMSERGQSESAKPEPSAVADEYARPEVNQSLQQNRFYNSEEKGERLLASPLRRSPYN